MITVTNQELLVAARKAYNEKTLTAQAPSKEDNVCLYGQECKDGVFRTCAVGAVFDKEFAKKHAGDGEVYILRQKEFANFENISLASNLQKLHDDWCRVSRNYKLSPDKTYNINSVQNFEKQFVDFLEKKEKEYGIG